MRVAERISGLLERYRTIALAGVIVGLIFLVFSGSAMASSSPSIEGESVTNVTAAEATLEAHINPGGLETTYEFLLEYGCENAQPGRAMCLWRAVKVVGQGQITAGDSTQSISVSPPLQPNTSYAFWVVATNSTGETTGRAEAFTTPAPVSERPTIESESASNVTSTDATLEAQIDPQGLETTYEFYLEAPSCQSFGPGYCEASGGTPIASGTIPAGSSAQTVSVDLVNARGDLSPSTIYGYRVVATSSAGEGFGGEKTFTTPPATAPVVDSLSYSHLTPSDATLEAQIDTEGLPTTYQFTLWSSPCSSHGAGCEVLIDIPLPSGRLLGSFVDQSVSLDLNSAGVTLKGGEYGYSLTASNAVGSTVGAGGTFEPPTGVLDPPSPGASLPPAGGQPGQSGGDGSQATGSGDVSASSTPGVKTPGPQVGKSAKLEPLTRAQKLARSLKACQSKPKKHRASCEKLARGRYGAAHEHKR